MLSPVLAEFSKLHPNVTVELLTDPRPYSLSRLEADLVKRITPFDEPEVIARKLVTIPYGLYAPPDHATPTLGGGEGCSLILMDMAFGGMPDVSWVTQALPRAKVVCRSNNREVQARLCALGASFAVLPRPLANVTPGIRLVDLGMEPPSRETWIGYHRDLKRLLRPWGTARSHPGADRARAGLRMKSRACGKNLSSAACCPSGWARPCR